MSAVRRGGGALSNRARRLFRRTESVSSRSSASRTASAVSAHGCVVVATVVNLTSASCTERYFRVDGHESVLGAPDDDGADNDSPNTDGGDYYARAGDEHRKASHWRGRGAAALGLKGHVEPDAFRRVLQGHVPGTDLWPPHVRPGSPSRARRPPGHRAGLPSKPGRGFF